MASVEGVPACLLATVPVVQPPHLEGDPTLATEILPGPPSLQSIQQGVARKDHKKSGPAFSYLPVSDPGTTYGGHMVSPLAPAPNEVDGPRRKRARLDKNSASSRAQRASARNLAAGAPPEAPLPLESVASSSQVVLNSDPLTVIPDSEDAIMSRANSAPLLEDAALSVSAKRPKKDKGKEKEKDVSLRVKEEALPVGLHSYEASPALPNNEDHCSACRSLGSLVYCDGCPRAYHLWCLDPPIEEVREGEWFCPACTRRQNPPSKPPTFLKFMAPLVSQAQNALPVEFQLPQEIRTFFKDVGTGTKGTYTDTSEIKPPRLNRHGQLEDREPYRLKDRNGEPVLCFKCGKSALPPNVAAAAPAAKRARRSSSVVPNTAGASGRMIISCDYCHLHWHLDCLDPPLAFMPPWSKKWMCPNHVDQILMPKKRVPRQMAPVEVTKPGQWNNGNIEIIHPETSSPIVSTKVAVDEVLINGRRYRVPERVITMDFWNRAQGRDKGKAKEVPMEEVDYTNSASSSPLTELSSLPDIPDLDSPPPAGLFDLQEIQAALFLCNLQSHQSSDIKTEEASRPSTNGISKRPPRASSSRAAEKIAATRASEAYQPPLHHSKPKVKRPAATNRPDGSATEKLSFPVPALRELRPKIDHKDAFPASLSAPAPNGVDTSESASVGPQSSLSPVEEPSTSKASTRLQRLRNLPRRTPAPLTGAHTSKINRALSDFDDDTPELSPVEDLFIPPSKQTTHESKKRGRPVLHKKPATPAPAPSISTPITPSTSKADAPATSTPSLKIRLPRLNTLTQHSTTSVAHAEDGPSVSAPPAVSASSPPKRGRGRPRKHPTDRPLRGRPPKSSTRKVERHASSSRTSATEIPLADTQMGSS